jgi:hypothetical protein
VVDCVNNPDSGLGIGETAQLYRPVSALSSIQT